LLLAGNGKAGHSTPVGVYRFTSCLTRSMYFDSEAWYNRQAGSCAASLLFGVSSSSWIPVKICLMVTLGFHPFSSFKMLCRAAENAM
jgi:hypothetical protein